MARKVTTIPASTKLFSEALWYGRVLIMRFFLFIHKYDLKEVLLNGIAFTSIQQIWTVIPWSFTSSSSSSSFWPASVSQWHAHSRTVVFHTLQRVQRDMRLWPLISYRLIHCTLTFALPRESSFTSLRHSYPLPPSAVASAASCAPARSIPVCSHHRIPNRAPGALSEPSHRFTIDRVAM